MIIVKSAEEVAIMRQCGRILADILEVELATVTSVEGAAYGAALLAATGAGVFPDIDSACMATIQISGTTAPGPGSAIYQEIYPLYRDLYPALKAVYYPQIAQIGAE